MKATKTKRVIGGSKLRLLPLSVCFVALSAHAQIETSLIGYWQFEDDLTETSGTHTAGLHDGVESGTVAYTASHDVAFGQALDLDGSNGVYVKNSANTEGAYAGTFDADINTANAMSISFWAQGVPGSWNPFVSKHGEGSEGWQVRRRSAAQQATFTLRSTGGVDDPTATNVAATATGWRHFVAVWDGASGTRTLYINGVEDTSMTIASGDTSIAGPGNALDKLLTIGMRDGGAAAFGNFFNGEIDDVAIWSRPLTDLEALHLSKNPLSAVIGRTDTDGDGLFDDQERGAEFGETEANDSDTDGDGVNDFVEVHAGSDALNDNDFDVDGLMNSEETSGSENPYSNETTEWNVADSDDDGINDGDEVGLDNGYATNPNSADTDNDGWTDESELGATPPSDPTNDSSVPSIDTGLVGYWAFEDNLTETSGVHAPGLHDGLAQDNAGVNPIAYIANPDTDFGQSLQLDGSNGVYIQNSANTEAGYADTFDADINIANAMTISLWVNGDPGRWVPFASKHGEGSEGWQLRQRDQNADITFTLRSTAGEDDPVGTNLAGTNLGWRHILVVWDGSGSGTRKLYIDGIEDTTFAGNVGASDISTGGPGNALDKFLTFGMRHDGSTTFTNYFNGQLDDIAIWSRPLTAPEITRLANNPLNVVLANTDTDGDGLFDSQERGAEFGETEADDPDTDDDGVNDFDEVQAGSDALNDNDFDNDGLFNSEETSGSANTAFGNETTDWMNPDSDLDGILDGEEVVTGADTFITDPNDSDTDDDGFSDGAEVVEVDSSPISDPTDGDITTVTEWMRDLCGYWRFEDDLTDSGILGLDGIMDGSDLTETYVAGRFGQAIDLDYASRQHVVVSGNENYLDAVGSDVTVSTWVKAEALNERWAGIIGKGENSWRIARRNQSSGAAFAAGGTRNDIPTSDAIADTAPIDDGNWHHIVGVAEFGVAMRIYVNGTLVEERTDALPSVIDVNNPVWIGGNPDTGREWNGSIDDTAVWKRVLTAEEIYTIYSIGNDMQYLIDNDVAPIVQSFGIVTSGLSPTGDFSVAVTGLDPAKSYQMQVTDSLATPIFWTKLDTITGKTAHTFTETGSLGIGPTGFYIIVELP